MSLQKLTRVAWLGWQTCRHMGVGWTARRSWYMLQRRWGWFARRGAHQSWDELPLAGFLNDPALAEGESWWTSCRDLSPAFFFRAADRHAWGARLAQFDTPEHNPVDDAAAIQRGEFRFFEHEWVKLGLPPDWHRNPFTGERAPSDLHRSLIGDFGFGDIKLIWEPSRFAFVFSLVRAYFRTGDDAYAEMFWQLVASWRAANVPYRGANWKCEQETALRACAWIFGLHAFAESPATTPGRAAMLAQMLAVSAKRIEENIYYPVSQFNNHGMTAAMGLWTIGLLFPQFRDAARWRERGLALLESQARDLIYDDGAFSQHSFNYQRLMLHAYVWSIRLGELHNRPLAKDVVERVARAGDLLWQVQDEITGRVPCYGANDGALFLPLSNCDFQDYRPALQAAELVTRGKRRYDLGAWDEEAWWLCGAGDANQPASHAAKSTAVPSDLVANDGGYFTLRSGTTFAMLRAARFRHRPSHADQLHVDFWWRGINIACDAGTYSYNAPPPWDTGLTETRWHNTVMVDGQEQMRKASRFMMLPWHHGDAAYARSERGMMSVLRARYYIRSSQVDPDLTHFRSMVLVGDDCLIVWDHLLADHEHTLRAHWLMPDLPHEFDPMGELTLETAVGPMYVQWVGRSTYKPQASLVMADANSPRGWRSAYYHAREPALSLGIECRSALPNGLLTVFSPTRVQIHGSTSPIVVANKWKLQLNDHSLNQVLVSLDDVVLDRVGG